ncbi:hypothetical protein EU245_06625 [Lentibacillus lipolyticus]|nr:hypothetical protein EU245_06625 [Lentibacillus lipolyticus]
MQLETVKSILLWILVGFSLLLSFGLWNYKPEVENLPEDQYEDRVDLGGHEETIQSLIEPKSIIFQNGQNYYSFSSPNDSKFLYQDMRTWVLYDFWTGEANGRPSENSQIEITFPDVIPVTMLTSLFTFNEDPYLSDWSFKRLFITFNSDATSLNLTFLSQNGNKQATAVVNNSKKYDQLWQRLTTLDGLREYVRFDGAQAPIYIPKYQMEMASKSVAVQEISSNQMVNALFRNPDIVSPNQLNENEVYFTDSARGIMRVYQNRRTMEFQNPLQSPFERMEPEALLELSKSNINDHMGWTDEYNLMDIVESANTIRYQLFYDGYPVYGSNYASVIEQQYRIQELNQPNLYNRPLFSLENLLGKESTKLPSGNDVIYFLKNDKTYKPEHVEDIRVGYDLTYQSDADAITLEPAWFIKYSGSWQEMRFNDMMNQKGGS